jgi:hypothetical protein
MDKIDYNPSLHVDIPSPRCPVCTAPASIYKRKVHPTDVYEGHCPICGVLRVTAAALDEIDKSNSRHVVSAWLRHGGGKLLEVIKREHVQRVLKDSPKYTVLEKLDLTLQAIANRTDNPGEHSQFNPNIDFPLIYASGGREAIFYVHQLKNMGLLDQRDTVPNLTVKGYQRLAEIQRTGRQSSLAFVAMWFNPKTQSLFDDAIAPAVRAAGFEPLRIDKHEHINRIDDEIIAQIRRSRFMVADFTGQRAGVYFEAGMMLGLGRNVFWMCDRAELNSVHFDTRQYNFIDYATVAEARERLLNRIVAIEGEGPIMPSAHSTAD